MTEHDVLHVAYNNASDLQERTLSILATVQKRGFELVAVILVFGYAIMFVKRDAEQGQALDRALEARHQ